MITDTAPDLLRYGSFQRCSLLLDYVENEQKMREGEELLAWLERNATLGKYFWREVAEWWPMMDAIEHENMAVFFGHFCKEWTLDCMSEADQRTWLHLPRTKEITVYRGQDESIPVGLAWTTCRKKAEWFANAGLRGKRKSAPVILTAKLWKCDVALCMTGRGEREVVPFDIPTEYSVERVVSHDRQAA